MTWLDPSPLLPQFQAWASRFPVREPFGRLRKATQTEELTEAQQRQKAGAIAKALKVITASGAERMKAALSGAVAAAKARVEADMQARGETWPERRRRQMRDSQRRRRERNSVEVPTL